MTIEKSVPRLVEFDVNVGVRWRFPSREPSPNSAAWVPGTVAGVLVGRQPFGSGKAVFRWCVKARDTRG